MNMICIVCPKGCALSATKTNQGVVVEGNDCPRGEAFAKEELLAPKRTLTTTVKTSDDRIFLPVRTDGEIPKSMIFAAMEILTQVKVALPIQCGQVILKNILNTGVDVIATQSLECQVVNL